VPRCMENHPPPSEVLDSLSERPSLHSREHHAPERLQEVRDMSSA